MDETLKYFRKAIDAQSWLEINSLADSVADDHGERTERARAEAERRADEYLNRELSALAQQSRLTAEARRSENRRELLALRERFSADVESAAADKLREYTASDDYPARLLSLAEQAVEALDVKAGQAVTLFLRPEDMRHASLLCEGLTSVAAAARPGDILLGGVIAEADGRRADLSFDAAMRGARDRFCELFDMEIT